MGNRDSNQSGPKAAWQAAYFAAWLAGALAPQVLFHRVYKLGNGHFGYNILISIALLALGAFLVAGLARLFRGITENSPLGEAQRRWTVRLLGLAGACAFIALLPLGLLEHGWPWAVGASLAALAGWLGLSLVFAVRAHTRSNPRRTGRLLAGSGTPIRWRYNGVFWLLVFLVFLVVDLLSLGEIEHRHTWESVFLVLGRLLTLATLTLFLMLLAHALLAVFPPVFRWVIMAGAALIPALVLADHAARITWQQSLLALINSFTFTGRIDMEQLLAGGGLTITPLGLYLRLGALALVSFLVYLGLQKLSNKIPCRISTRRAVLVVGLLWGATIGQQALSKATLRREIWQAEHATFGVHLGLLAPQPGLVTIPVAFRETQSDSEREALLSGELPPLQRRPDIYVVMVETWRADSITPEIAPFLSRFRAEECQQFETTFSSSNCTPVSWFTFFHSRVGIHWKEVVEAEKADGGLRGAYPVRLLHKLGYRFSVRAVCDLGYQEMADCNFGSGHRLAEEVLDHNGLPVGAEIPEREVIIVDDLKEQLLSTPPGGRFHFLSFDSPHYNYYWAEKDFDPLHRDCIGNPTFPANPSKEHLREIVKRYENSINWIDHQVEELVAFLKSENRYDDAIIILTGDHGEDFQEYGTWYHCSNLKRPQTEVPLMIKWPRWLEDAPSQPLATHLDVMPSLFDVLGLEERFSEKLAGRSLLREHPGETILSTQWGGNSRIGVCFVKDGLKANFRAHHLWTGNVPDTLYFMGYSDFDDQPLDPLELRGGETHLEALRRHFPECTSRYFSTFGEQ